MDSLPHPLAFLLLLVSGWLNRQHAVIVYLLEKNPDLPRRARTPNGSQPLGVLRDVPVSRSGRLTAVRRRRHEPVGRV
jgi:hypothetical protein